MVTSYEGNSSPGKARSHEAGAGTVSRPMSGANEGSIPSQGSIGQKVCSSLRTAEIAVLEAASDRFDEYLTDRHYSNEEAVLQDLLPSTSAKRLIRAVAEWRIAKREGA